MSPGGQINKVAVMSNVPTRKGARRPELVSAEVRAHLQAGDPSVNHMEQIAMDMGALLTWAFPELAAAAGRLRQGGLLSRMRGGGEVLFDHYGPQAWIIAATSTSDTVRGWGAMAVCQDEMLDLTDRLEALRPFADDEHFAVREWAWLALRADVVTSTAQAVELLTPWADDRSPRIRRFASEATRPRGVWSVHVPKLKQDPEIGRGLLHSLRRDEARYVQDSVSNWLNDVSRTRPDWVQALCAEWLAEGAYPSTERICRRAQRSLRRAGSLAGAPARD
jgi:3-methyladenine DNA glycosylase AlkC